MSANQTKYPQLRFKGFTDSWEQRKLGKMGYTFTGLSGKTKEDFGHGNAKFVTYMNVFSSPVSNSEMVENVEVDSKQHQVEYGDVFFTTSSETPQEVGMSSVWLETAENIYLNSFCFGYHPMVEFDPYYLAFMLRSPVIRKKFMLLAQGISRYNISKNKVMEMLVPVPEIVEQQKIGSFFKQLDDTITLHQRKLAKLKELKQGYLQKLFPENGSKFPQLRFAGFADAWEQRKLSDGTNKIGDGLHGTPKYSEDGEVYFVNGNNLVNGQIVIMPETKTVTSNEQSKDDKALNESTILMSINGTIGNLAWYRGENLMLGKSAAYIEVSDFDKKFIYAYLQTRPVKDYYLNSLTGTTIKNLGLKAIRNTNICTPTIDEQAKIGVLFQNLDKTITLHQRKLEKLQELKKGYLQKMFC
ncbi:type I restriction modification DNA specificity domain protein [Lacticaseibacillus rhamnosus LMS2-1]|uniref:Type I restriction modification DNA specificity domain protein n=1 Tax=Lacticaseibacillus rhamnosus (strain LMS2-1) TaxID=525361 RepID=C2JSX8_LACRM|nr:restriction endonuclease subunit S [Lacticaseibacillus rhamnosus]EEN81840.1 type I restriction modification DNA specificity domain protein [Lacticaseibacillus rhamnosus LMS2-1]